MKELASRLVSVAVPAAARVLGSVSGLAAGQQGLPYLGPDGFRSVKLTMTEAHAVATGLLTGRRVLNGWLAYQFIPELGTGDEEHGDVLIGANGRVHSISATSRMLTHEGVWKHMPLHDIAAIYPRLAQDERQHHLFRAPVPGNSAASYTFTVDDGSLATRVTLHSNADPRGGI